MEGKLHVDGLQTMDQDDDLLTAMARELVTHQGVGERAAEIWRSLTKTNQSATESSANIETPRPPHETSEEPEPRIWTPSKSSAVQLSLF
jgi:hypothetical protein